MLIKPIFIFLLLSYLLGGKYTRTHAFCIHIRKSVDCLIRCWAMKLCGGRMNARKFSSNVARDWRMATVAKHVDPQSRTSRFGPLVSDSAKYSGYTSSFDDLTRPHVLYTCSPARYRNQLSEYVVFRLRLVPNVTMQARSTAETGEYEPRSAPKRFPVQSQR